MGGEDGKITMGCLRRVARELKEDVPEQGLRDMLLEANGGSGVGRGVGIKDFEGGDEKGGSFQVMGRDKKMVLLKNGLVVYLAT
ncbi:hypothetical protein ABVK25_000463 [Lepraria finkii]|uniref:Uncharacterized protein n=1 Tax=Lepraria finkii TaxID=1340010 RepID=A0ABR4BMZ1_9LECA